MVLSQEPYNFNTRAVGHTEDFALVPVDAVHLIWADQIVCVEPRVEQALREKYAKVLDDRVAAGAVEIVTLDVPDIYNYRDPKLMEIIRKQYDAATTKVEP